MPAKPCALPQSSSEQPPEQSAASFPDPVLLTSSGFPPHHSSQPALRTISQAGGEGKWVQPLFPSSGSAPRVGTSPGLFLPFMGRVSTAFSNLSSTGTGLPDPNTQVDGISLVHSILHPPRALPGSALSPQQGFPSALLRVLHFFSCVCWAVTDIRTNQL